MIDMTKRIALPLALVACLLGGSCIEEAHASPPLPVSTLSALPGYSAAQVAEVAASLPAGVPLSAVQMIPGVGPGYVDSFTVSCTSAAAALIRPTGGAMVSYTCQNASTTLVHVGDSGISDPGTTRDAPIYCATNCPAQEFGGNARAEYCRGDTDTTIYCRGLVAVTSAP